MADRQDNGTGKGSRSFGDIPIQPERDSLQVKTGRRKTKSRRAVQPPKRTFPYLTLPLYIPVVFFLLYVAGSLYLVPVVIKGPFAEQLSQRLNRPVSVDDVSFSPFTFRLHLASLTIGPDSSRKNDHELCRVGMIEAHVQPTSLFRGKVAVEDIHIDQLRANLVRYLDGGYTAFSTESTKTDGQNTGNLNILPHWLLVLDLQLTDGTLTFHDLPARQQHSISSIQLNLPGANRDNTGTEPTLRAMVNSSPILIRGQHHTSTDGGIETRLSLQLKDIQLQQYLSYLPSSINSLRVTSGRADASFEITFQDKLMAGNGPTVTGSVSISALALQTADTTGQLKVPAAQMVIRAKPLQSLYTVKELSMDMPQLLLPDSHPSSLMNIQDRFASLLDPAGIALEIEHLEINNGSFTTANHEGWHNLRLQLTRFHNMASIKSQVLHSSPSPSLTFKANRGTSTIGFKGETDSSFTLSGKISMQDMDTNLLQQFLSPADGTRFTQGKIGLAGELLAKQEGKGEWIINNSSLLVSDFSLHRQESLMAAGKEMRATGCTMQVGNHHMSCQKISFDQAGFTAEAALSLPADRQKKTENSLPFSCNNLTITNSTAVVPLPQADITKKRLHVSLSKLNMQLTGIKEEQPGQNNLSLTAVVGTQGKIELSGNMQSNGQGVLQLAAADIDIRPFTPLFTDWLKPQVNQGAIQFKGSLMLPDNRFVGSFHVEDFTADNKNGSAVSWQRASGREVMVKLTPFSAAIKDLSLLQPSIRLSADRAELPTVFSTLFIKNDDLFVLPPVAVENCTIDNGSLVHKATSTVAQLLEFNGVKGTISPLRPATLSSFNLSGKMDTADFTLSGFTGLNTGNNFELNVSHFQLTPLSTLFFDLFKINAHNSSADWSVSSSSPDSGRIRLTGLKPFPDSAYYLLLALLTDTTGSFSLPVPAPTAADPADLISGTVAGQLRQLLLLAAISSRLVLDKFMPELNLPREIEFLPGETVPDFMAGLADYVTLLEQRPHLILALRGNMDENTDHRYLLNILQEAADTKRELENLHREQLRTQLLAVENQRLASQREPADKERLHYIEQRTDLQPLPREELRLPDNTLQNLARQRAEEILSYLTNDLMIPEDRIELQESGSGGTQVDLILKPYW